MSSHTREQTDLALEGAEDTPARGGALRSHAVACASLSGLLGLTVVVGWHLHAVGLVRLAPVLESAQYVTALGLVVASAAVLAEAAAFARAAHALAAVAALLGGATLLQHAVGVDLGIDQLVVAGDRARGSAAPGRMAPDTALAFLLVGAALLVGLGLHDRRLRFFVRTAAAGMLVAIAVVALGLHAYGAESSYGWGALTRMPPPVAVGFLLLAVAVAGLAERPAASGGRLPGAIVVVGCTAAILVSQVLHVREWTHVEHMLDQATVTLRTTVRQLVEPRLSALGRMAQRWNMRGGMPRAEWESDAAGYLDDHRRHVALERVDGDLRVLWAVPHLENEVVRGRSLGSSEVRQAAFAQARATGAPTVSGAVDLVQGGRGFIAAVPLRHDGLPDGFLVTVFRFADILAPALEDLRALGYEVAMADDTGPILAASDPAIPAAGPARRLQVSLPGARWTFALRPREATLPSFWSPLPLLGLLGTGAVTLMLAVTVSSAQRARRRAALLRDANVALAGAMEQRRRAEAAAVEAHRTRELILRAAGEGICGVDRDGRITFVNAAAATMIGWGEGEPIGRAQHDVMCHARPDGSPYERADCPVCAACADGALRHHEDELFRRKDGTSFPVEYTSVPIRSEGGALEGAVVTFRDVNVRRRAELALLRLTRTLEERVAARTEDLMRANEKLARSNQELDEFAHVVSHDLKEPLRGIAAFSAFLLADHGERLDEDAHQKLATLVRLSKRLGQLIDALLAFSRVGRAGMEAEETSLEPVVAEVLDRLAFVLAEAGVQVRVGPLPTCVCDAVRIGEVFANLISNAVKYNDKAEKRIEIGAVLAPEGPGSGNGSGDDAGDGDGPQPVPVLFVRDNGIGIRAKDLTAVFRIFRRLHGREEFGGGTGVGLTIGKRIVERHGGRMWIESTPGEGTTVHFTLAEGPTQTAHEPHVAELAG